MTDYDADTRAGLLELINPRLAAFLSHPDLVIRLVGGVIWVGMGLYLAGAIITVILTAPTAAAWLIQLLGQMAWGGDAGL